MENNNEIVKCPRCGSTHINKFGHQPSYRGGQQRYICVDCSKKKGRLVTFGDTTKKGVSK